MLTLNEIQNGILEIARNQLGRDAVKRVQVESDVDLDGKESLRITIVLRSSGTKLAGGKLSKIKIETIDFLQGRQDDRFPYTHYATESDLRALAE